MAVFLLWFEAKGLDNVAIIPYKVRRSVRLCVFISLKSQVVNSKASLRDHAIVTAVK